MQHNFLIQLRGLNISANETKVEFEINMADISILVRSWMAFGIFLVIFECNGREMCIKSFLNLVHDLT